jgi:hypothetical protein
MSSYSSTGSWDSYPTIVRKKLQHDSKEGGGGLASFDTTFSGALVDSNSVGWLDTSTSPNDTYNTTSAQLQQQQQQHQQQQHQQQQQQQQSSTFIGRFHQLMAANELEEEEQYLQFPSRFTTAASDADKYDTFHLQENAFTPELLDNEYIVQRVAYKLFNQQQQQQQQQQQHHHHHHHHHHQ